MNDPPFHVTGWKLQFFNDNLLNDNVLSEKVRQELHVLLELHSAKELKEFEDSIRRGTVFEWDLPLPTMSGDVEHVTYKGIIIKVEIKQTPFDLINGFVVGMIPYTK